MENSSPIFAKPPSDNISLEDCEFYHVMDIPGISEPTEGIWDLRKGVDDYLGHVDFKNKTVLELGPSNGYLTFHMEKLGENVTSIDVDLKKKNRDVVRSVKHNWQEELNMFMMEERRRRNAYWYAHKALNSKSKLIESHVNDLPAEIGMYDISSICAVLLHIQNPFLALEKMLSHTREKVIITEPGGFSRIKSFRNIIRNLIRKTKLSPEVPSMTYLPRLGKRPFVWWKLSPEIISNMASTLGFEKNTITYHKQTVCGRNTWFFTVVCERTVPIENCYYD